MFLIQKLKWIREKFLRRITDSLTSLETRQSAVELRIEYIQEALGRIESRQLNHQDNFNLSDNEYRVFSQWGEDGIIQFLLKYVEVEKKIFVEFGVEDYREANTRFLLINNNWSGLVIDGDEDNINRLKSQRIYWLYNLKAVQAFITKQNINQLLKNNGIIGEIGLLSIDIDGNDYWVWQAIDVINPVIVSIEYNHRFGSDIAVTIPYDENFVRSKVHHSWIYFGASLKALCLLAKRKGYAFVGCSSNGVNAFFIRKDAKPDNIREVSPEEGYVQGQFCEVRNENGELSKIMSLEEERLLVMSLPLVYVEDI
jgi:hypothetical protein